MEELLTLPGVGRKTANLVLILSFKSRKNICVDTHVHRISNRLGWVRTRTPEETEQALYKSTRARWWPYINLYLVTWGQNVCRPVYPRCGACAIREHCPQIGVTKVVDSDDSRPTTKHGSIFSACLFAVFMLSWLAWSAWNASLAQSSGPVIVVETSKGTFEFETYPDDAPKTVAHVVALVKQRVLRRPAHPSRAARLSRAVGRSALA